METLKYCKVRDVKSIARAHADDAGIDFYIPEDIDEKTWGDKCDVTKCYPAAAFDSKNILQSFILKPGQSVLIPSGIHVKIPHGYALIYMNKSGVASKKHLHVGACVTGNTEIKTNKGLFSAVTLTKDFCENNDILVYTKNLQTNNIEQHKCDGFRQVKTSKCIRVTFDDGSVIEGDEEHQILIDGKWIMLKDLQ